MSRRPSTIPTPPPTIDPADPSRLAEPVVTPGDATAMTPVLVLWLIAFLGMIVVTLVSYFMSQFVFKHFE